MSDMQREDTERKVQENCNLCKSVAQVVSASSVDVRNGAHKLRATLRYVATSATYNKGSFVH